MPPRSTVLAVRETSSASPGAAAPAARFGWQRCATLRERMEAMQQRRPELQDEMAACSHTDEAALELLMEEWYALLEARNSLTQQMVQEENEELKEQGLADLHTYLVAFQKNNYEFSAQEEPLCARINALCSALKQHSTAAQPARPRSMSVAREYALVCAPAPPTPPPPPPPLALPMALTGFASSSRRTSLSSTLTIESFSPLNAIPEQSLLDQSSCNSMVTSRDLIMLSKTQLRPVGGTRSPGGTPARPKQQAHHFLTQALKNKFRNAKQPSPISQPASPRWLQLPGGGSPAATTTLQSPKALPSPAYFSSPVINSPLSLAVASQAISAASG